MSREICGMDLVNKAKKLDLKMAKLHQECKKYCDRCFNDETVLNMLLADLEDGHAGAILINEVQWRLRETSENSLEKSLDKFIAENPIKSEIKFMNKLLGP